MSEKIMIESVGPVCRERDALRARVAELEAGMSALLGSASPHPVEHPTMAAAWEAARMLLAKGTVIP